MSSADTAEAQTPWATLRLLALSALVGGAALTIWALSLRTLGPPEGAPYAVPVVLLASAFALSEMLSVHLETRGEAHALTFSEIPFVAGLLLVEPTDLILARILSGIVVLGIVRRQSIRKLFFNLSLFAAEIALGAWIYRSLLGDAVPVDEASWPPAFLALLAAYLLDVAAVTFAIWSYTGRPAGALVRRVALVGSIVCVANTATGLALVTSLWERSYTGLLLGAIASVLFVLHRAYVRLTERHKNLETLHDFTRRLGGSLELHELEREVLLGARSILRGEQAVLLLPPIRAGSPATRLIAAGDDVRRMSISPTELAADLTMLLPEGKARLFEPGQPVPGWLGELGIKDAAIVPVTTDGLPTGAVVVANRLTEVSTFVEEDLQLFETLASHAGVALENGRLVAHLQHEAAEKAHEALHDAVTGLPNRSALTHDLTEAIAQARAEATGVGLVFVDLDTFKEVNDTLGTVTAERLLVEVRQRLAGLVPAEATLARFIGDQFAVLVRAVSDGTVVMRLAESLHSAFDAPFTSDTVSLVLGASVGVALYPEHASSADVLLQRADAATYVARSEGSGIELYAADTDPYAPRRLALAADLREALDAGEVDVYVQPKVSMTDGVVRGAEALVRWTHPRLGPMNPSQFIPAAEHTGVIRALTLYVVKDALAQCVAWRETGYDLGIAVNLSARNLFDLHLADDIAELVRDAGLPPGVLTLELTESTVMSDSQRSLAVLDLLDERGIRLSVDDFGTGYSSLSHLRQLPVSELKIDRSFVSTMTLNEHDAVIVQTLVELGRNLGMRTVAEGVESREAWDLLQRFGCDEAQGFLLSRPLPAEQFTSWLTRQQVARLEAPEGVVPFLSRRRVVGGQESRH